MAADGEGGTKPDGLADEVVKGGLHRDEIDAELARLTPADSELFAQRGSVLLAQTAALLDVSRAVHGTLSIAELMPRISTTVMQLIDAEACALFLRDRESADLLPYGDLDAIAPDAPELARDVFERGAFATSVYEEGEDKRAVLCVPIRTTGGEIIGAAQVCTRRGEGFNTEDLGFFSMIAAQVAPAFANVELHKEMRRAREEERALLEVTARTSYELDIDALLRKLMTAVSKLLDADRSTLFMHDPDKGQLWSRVAEGIGSEEIRFPAHMGLAGAVLQTGETINIPDAYADDRFNPDIDKQTGYRTRSILCMPVTNKAGVRIGVTQVLNKRSGPFTAADQRRLAAFSSQASIAIENAKLFADATRIKTYNDSVLETMKSGVITLDEEGCVTKLNGNALHLVGSTGDTQESLLGRSAEALFAGKNRWVADAIAAVGESGEPDFTIDEQFWPAGSEAVDSSVSIDLSVIPLRVGGGETGGSLLVIEDITNEARLHSAMARYLPKELADRAIHEEGKILGGQMQKATVLFAGLAGFPALSETVGPRESVKLLNAYFSIMVDVILDNGGILDNYLGNSLMAVFGAPFSGEHDADNAVRAGVGMLRAVRAFNLETGKVDQALKIGIGVNTAEVLCGTLGSDKRMDFTVIGDGVNLAARLQAANGPYGSELLLSEMTIGELRGSHLMRRVDNIRVKGKDEAVGVYQILDHYDESMLPRMGHFLGLFDQGMALYQQREWSAAEQAFYACLTVNPYDSLCNLYRYRCRYYAANPPPEHWDGVWLLEGK